MLQSPDFPHMSASKAMLNKAQATQGRAQAKHAFRIRPHFKVPNTQRAKYSWLKEYRWLSKSWSPFGSPKY